MNPTKKKERMFLAKKKKCILVKFVRISVAKGTETLVYIDYMDIDEKTRMV